MFSVKSESLRHENVLNYSRKLKKNIISITSGKGGVGKTLTTVNFAISAQQMGHRVLILDGDLGLANVDIVLGLRARYNIRDVLDGHINLKDIIVTGPMGIQLIPTGSGISSLTQLTDIQKMYLQEQICEIEDSFDLLLIDTGAGISDNVIHLNRGAENTVIVTTPEPHAMTDAYALMKVFSQQDVENKLSLVVNMTRSPEEGVNVYSRLSSVAKKFLGKDLHYLGSVPLDPQVSRAVLLRNAVSEKNCHTIAGQAWKNMMKSMLAEQNNNTNHTSNFWQSLLWGDHNERNVASVGAY